MSTISSMWMGDVETSEAAAIVSAWTGTDPMRSRAEVREALACLASGRDIAAENVDRLLPAVCEEAARRGLLVEDGRPTRRVFVGSGELEHPEIVGREACERLLTAVLTGAAPGTTGRVDVFTYPGRRGAHAYRAEISMVVGDDGVPR